MWHSIRRWVGALLLLPTIPFFTAAVLVVDGWAAFKDELLKLRKELRQSPKEWWDEVPPL